MILQLERDYWVPECMVPGKYSGSWLNGGAIQWQDLLLLRYCKPYSEHTLKDTLCVYYNNKRCIRMVLIVFRGPTTIYTVQRCI